MRKVFLDELPRGGKYINKNSINYDKIIAGDVNEQSNYRI